MDPESDCFSRCGKHPLQIFTGICPSCLAERLSIVDPDERNPPSRCGDGSSLNGLSPVAQASEVKVTEVQKVENLSCAQPVSENESSTVRVRQTLWSLFYLNNDDDDGDYECHVARRADGELRVSRKGGALYEIGLQFESKVGYDEVSNGSKTKQSKQGPVSVTKAKNSSKGDENTRSFTDRGFKCGAGPSSVDNTSTGAQSCGSGNAGEEVGCIAESRIPACDANKYTQVESSAGDEVGNPTATTTTATVHDRGSRFPDSVLEPSLKKSPSVRLGFGLVKRILGWRIKFTEKRVSKTEANLVAGIPNPPSKNVVDKELPCRRELSDLIDGSSLDDGLSIGRTLIRSTSGRNERSMKHAEAGETLHPHCSENRDSLSDSLPHIRRMTKKVGSVDFEWMRDTTNTNISTPTVRDEDKPTSGVGFTGESNQGTLCGPSLNQFSCMRKFHGCSKVWDRVSVSSFCGFVQKSESVLDRSLSECWHESRKAKNREVAESCNKVRFRRNSSETGTALDKSQELVDISGSSLTNMNADPRSFHSVWRRKKNSGVLGHSRSIQYSSPNNLDNGLLRFYLTPISYSRRFPSRNTRRNPHYFW